MWALTRVATPQLTFHKHEEKQYQEIVSTSATGDWRKCGKMPCKCNVRSPLQLPQGRRIKWGLRGSLPGLCRARNRSDFDKQINGNLFLERV